MSTHKRPHTTTPDTASDTEEWRLLYEAYALLRKETDRALAPVQATAAQAYVLAALDVFGRPLPVTELARLMLQESPSVTRLVDRMSARDLVERLPDASDRRRALVAATDRGKDLLEQMRGPANATTHQAFGVLSRQERATFKRLLRKFTEAARARNGLTDVHAKPAST